MSRQKKEGGSSGMGAVSIFCILLVCCLSAFAILALVSANADARLSEKNAALVSAYYYADGVAETVLADLMSAWDGEEPPSDVAFQRILEQVGAMEAAVVREGGDVRISYAVALDEQAVLRLIVELRLHPPGSANRADRLAWSMETDESGDVYDNTLLVWQPPEGNGID